MLLKIWFVFVIINLLLLSACKEDIFTAAQEDPYISSKFQDSKSLGKAVIVSILLISLLGPIIWLYAFFKIMSRDE